MTPVGAACSRSASAASVLLVVVSVGGYLFAVKHYHLKLPRLFLRVEFIRAYLFDRESRRLATVIADGPAAHRWPSSGCGPPHGRTIRKCFGVIVRPRGFRSWIFSAG